jgi:hypothetical protein
MLWNELLVGCSFSLPEAMLLGSSFFFPENIPLHKE